MRAHVNATRTKECRVLVQGQKNGSSWKADIIPFDYRRRYARRESNPEPQLTSRPCVAGPPILAYLYPTATIVFGLCKQCNNR